jgi:hypothetical protein
MKELTLDAFEALQVLPMSHCSKRAQQLIETTCFWDYGYLGNALK